MLVNGLNQSGTAIPITALQSTQKSESQLAAEVIAVSNSRVQHALFREKDSERMVVNETQHNASGKKYGKYDLYLRAPFWQSVHAFSRSGVRIVSQDDSLSRDTFTAVTAQRDGHMELRFGVPVNMTKQALETFLAERAAALQSNETDDTRLGALIAAKTVNEIEKYPEKFSGKFNPLELQSMKVRYKSLLEKGKILLRQG